MELGAGSGLGGIRHLSVVDLRFDEPDAPRRCGLEASVQVHDSLTGATRAVYLGSCRPQLYLRTPD